MSLLFLAFFTFFFLSTPTWAEHKGTVPIQREGLWYYPFHEEPVNGRVLEWHENGQKESEGYYKEGKHDGLWTHWHANGQKESEVTFKEGKKNGLLTEWDKHGQKLTEIQ